MEQASQSDTISRKSYCSKKKLKRSAWKNSQEKSADFAADFSLLIFLHGSSSDPYSCGDVKGSKLGVGVWVLHPEYGQLNMGIIYLSE